MIWLLFKHYKLVWGLLTNPQETIVSTYYEAKKSAVSMAITILILSAFFAVCLIGSFFFYVMVYRLVIPITYQSEKVTFVMSTDGYEARIFHPHGKFPVCRSYEMMQNVTQPYDDYISKICMSPTHSTKSQMVLSEETYSIHLKLSLPLIQQNLDVGIFPVKTEFINKDTNAMKIEATGYVEDPISRLWFVGKILYIVRKQIGFGPKETVADVQLLEKFDNRLFDINVINILIPEKRIVVKEGYLELEAQLEGLRYFMAHWFWTTGVVMVGFMTFVSFVILSITFLVYRKANQIVKDVGNLQKQKVQ